MVMTNGLQLKKQQSGPALPEALESDVLSRKIRWTWERADGRSGYDNSYVYERYRYGKENAGEERGVVCGKAACSGGFGA
ncbi:hypothetical protein BIU88_07900 [Chlorobaculum limnaeum]|uniref:Uncharacterized protein n=1 Tax=Chlorobaculum limnaeum TaxID=274537 RepID=A0A1D8D4F2_CHLLM|nr:hypothetical protein BIU88_07900 [Chlorobaculum limnaeum]